MSETGLLPAYLIVGTDGVKRDHAVSRMKARLEKSGMVEFNLDERDMTKGPDIESIIGSLNTFPMGSEFRLVILDGCSKLAKAVSEPLVGYLASPSPTTVCLIIADSLAKNTRLYKAIAKIDKKAIVDCSGTKRWELPRRVQQMATQRGKSISTAAADFGFNMFSQGWRLYKTGYDYGPGDNDPRMYSFIPLIGDYSATKKAGWRIWNQSREANMRTNGGFDFGNGCGGAVRCVKNYKK